MTRLPLIAANWKMNPPPEGWDADGSSYHARENANVIVFPAMPNIAACVEAGVITGGQCGRPEKNGAFTGDVSMQMLSSYGCTYVLCGHSERRQHHQESDEMIASQVAAALEAGLTPILCIGETLDQREIGEAEDTVKKQLEPILNTQYSIPNTLILAYEPVWAIGTGKTATPEDAQKMHAFIRSLLPSDMKDDMRILYGGSVKPASAPELIAQEDIDGFLVGGASLIPGDFAQIVDAAVKTG